MSELASAPRRGGAVEASTPPDPIPAVVASPPPEQPDTARTAPAAPVASSAPVAPSTTAGSLLGGRYRLSTRVGSDTAAGAEFWRAEDTVLQRDVAMTVLRRPAPELDPPGSTTDDDDPTARAGEMVVRALRSGSFDHPGCSRLLDVLASGGAGVPDDVLGASVTEWVPGRSLAEAVTEGLVKPLTAARWVAPLAAAAEEAHRHGFVLGCDHPERVRITPDGRAQLCFALPRPDTLPADDVRGLGAVLYTLLTSRWPLSGADAARAGLAAAPRGKGGAPTAPSTQRPGVPIELDTLTAGALGPADETGHVHTAAAVHRMLGEVVAEEDTLFPPVHDGVPAEPEDTWQDGGRPPPVDPRRRRKLLVGLAVLAVAVVVVFAFVGLKVGSLFSDGDGPVIKVGNDPAGTTAQPAQPDGDGGLAAVAGVGVYSPAGDLDNPGRVARVVDGDPSSNWRTYSYKQQFPALKQGVGLMVSFASAVQLSSVTIRSPSPGTVMEVRSASATDAALGDTAILTRATLDDGTTDVPLAGSQPVTHLLLWITKLGGGGSDNVTQIDELQFHRAAG